METDVTTESAPHRRPIRIAASYLMDDANVSADYANELHQLAANASRVLAGVADDVQVVFFNALQAGAEPESVLSSVDGVLLLGGTDVDPHRFTDDAQRIAEAKAYSAQADSFEMSLALGAADRGLPVLGICRGEQVMNVAFGGSLITDLGADNMHTTAGGEDWCDHEVTISEGSRLAAIYPERSVAIRSGHHQAVADVAPGFQVTAVAPDGIIEAIESADDRWLVGVQWHPEAPEGNAEHFDLLGAAFIGEARRARAARVEQPSAPAATEPVATAAA